MICCCFGRNGFQKGLPDVYDEENWSYLQKQHGALRNYLVKQEIGDGAFSKVLSAEHQDTGEEIALKVVNRKAPRLKPSHWEILKLEAWALETCRHPHVVDLQDCIEDQNAIVMVLELLKGGELLQHIKRVEKLSETQAKNLFRQVAQAVAHIHSKGLMHRDLKLENVLFVDPPREVGDEVGTVKLIDFGMAARYDPATPIRQAMGTAGYLAPECCHSVPHSPAMDMWSLGMMLFVVLCGRMPYSHLQIEKLLYPEIDIRCSAGFKSASFQSLSRPAKDLVLRLLDRNPRNRATADEVLQHPWLKIGEAEAEGAASVAADAACGHPPLRLPPLPHPRLGSTAQSAGFHQEL